MELDQLKTSWNTVNERLESLESQNRALSHAFAQTETRKAASLLRREPVFELVVGILAAVWAGGFLAAHLDRIPRMPLGALPATIIFAISILTIGISVRQLVLISDLDYSGPILETQKGIAALRAIRVRSTQGFMLFLLPLWVIFPIFLGQCLVAFELAGKFDAAWLLANLAVGAVISIGIVASARRWGHLKLFQAINETLAGTEIGRAQKLLADVEAFAS